MRNIKLSDSEMKFMNLIWDNAPINSTELVKLVEASLGWKKSTTYTVLKRLSQRDILKNENAIVSYLVQREEVQQIKGDEILGKMYNGSIKLFLASFLNKEKISKEEAKELANMIEEYIEKDE